MSVPGRGHHFNRPVTREAGEHVISHGHQHGIADAGGNSRGGVVHDRQRGASAGGDIQAIAGKDLQVLGDHLGVVQIGLNKGVTGNQPIDVFLGDAGIFERQLGCLHIQLGGAEVWHHPDFGVGRANNRHCAAERRHHPPLLFC